MAVGVRRLPAPVRRFARLVAIALIVEYLLVPQLAGSRRSWHLLLDADNAWLVVALALEVASLLVYGALSWRLLPADCRPSYWRVLRIDLSTLAVSHTVPAGSAVGLGLGYRLLTAAGVPGPAAATSKATQAVGSAVVLNVLLFGGLVSAVTLHGFTSAYGVAAAVALGLLLFAVVATAVLTRHDREAADLAGRVLGKLPFLSGERVRDAVRAAAAYLATLGADRRKLFEVALLAAANWLLDAGALWACVRAFGHSLGPGGAIVPYAIANVLAAIPFTPGGLGIVEAFLIPALVGFSVPRATAILGVLAWRALNFLLPIPVGFAAYLTMPTAKPASVDPSRSVPTTGDGVSSGAD
jgi:uncharacterized protein (TIRG00374 family)